MSARSVCCRGSTSRFPPVSTRKRSSSRSRSCRGLRIFTRAAASSIASGIPSSRRQISTTVDAFSSVSAKRWSAEIARSTKSATAGAAAASAARRPSVPVSPTASDGSRYVASPVMPSPCRLDASTETFGQPRMIAQITFAEPSMRCSQLSSTRSACHDSSVLTRCVSASPSGGSESPSACAIAAGM